MNLAFLRATGAFSGQRLALFLLAVANLCLILIVASGVTPLGEAIAPLTGHLVGIGLAASMALLVRRHAWAILVGGSAVTIALHVWLGVAHCCGPPSPGVDSRVASISGPAMAPPLNVIALNTWHENRDPQRMVRYLGAADADVVVLSEFGADKRVLLASLREVYPYQVDCAQWACSLALLSRVPFEASGFAARPSSDMPSFVWARLAGSSATVVGTHLYRPSRAPWKHAREMQALIDFVRHIDGPLILAGDLNTSPWSSSLRTLRRRTALRPVSFLTPTWPAWPLVIPQVALDHILVSPDISLVRSGTGPAVGSDHLPIWAQLDLPRPLRDRAAPSMRGLASGPAATRAHLGGQFLADLGGEHGRARDLRR